MAVARSLLVSVSCAALLLAAVVVPTPLHAESNGVPLIEGQWVGTLTSVYWDQSIDAAVRPVKKFRGRVTVEIDQDADELTMTINFEDPNLFPATSATTVAQLILDGFGGNYHFGVSMSEGPAVTLSGNTDRRAARIRMTGTASSSDLTHEIRASLKRAN